MIHRCSICKREFPCPAGDDCEYPVEYPANCGIENMNPKHQEEYIKATQETNQIA